MNYEKPKLDLLTLDNHDVIRTSDIVGGGLIGGGSGDGPIQPVSDEHF